MKQSLFILLPLLALTSITSASAQQRLAPEMGNIHATAHQLCGENITVQIARSDDGFTVIGLNNKSTMKLDLFISDNPGEVGKSYSRFSPVTFDILSGHFVKADTTDIDIVWGGAVDDKQAVKYQLALGNYTYQCDALMDWPKDKANELYGEPLKETLAAGEKETDDAAKKAPEKQAEVKVGKVKA